MSAQIEPFTLNIPQAELDRLARKLDDTRWPERETVKDWSQGAPLAKVQALCDYWRNGYDWRRCEARLNGLGQFKTEIDGLGIHFLHIKSPEANALPLIMTHGWPGSVIEFMKVIGPLTDPVAHGGKAEDAFHLVLPSLPGYGFSDRPAETGWKVDRIARAWIELMKRLGYERWVAQGGDWGAAVTTQIGLAAPAGCLGIHLNMPIIFPGKIDNPTPEEQKQLEKFQRFMTEGSGYSHEQGSKPQTLGYGLTDSPAGQAAWIYEKFHGWTDCNGDPENVLTKDEMLDNIMLYWLTATATSSGRLYWESIAGGFEPRPISIPVGVSIFPYELMPVVRSWADKVYPKLIHWNEPEIGGHFAAFEQPAIFVDELRTCFRQLR